ncbi:leucine-rich repeat domain-containing protein [Candidatus Cytomitobacter indipagum]|uniref:Leucine-rich repeat domain-containing protein n=1 Tax=Candidatus Cytomitobacter indipagum TaxID=2601575 RepID=A0A5C0UE24_9PROT|nr:leucine-rich repeat domain-containing protein [Candidatus Cytomitobacter indipagum]QEK37957.1 leucine-rich repeat domain-containing protein [Candidatus Cytomitobacter indipagum]
MQSIVATPDQAMLDEMRADIEIYKKVRKENDECDKAIALNRRHIMPFMFYISRKQVEVETKDEKGAITKAEEHIINADNAKDVISFLTGDGLFYKIDPSNPNYVENENYKLSYPFDALKYNLAHYIDVNEFRFENIQKCASSGILHIRGKEQYFSMKYVSMHDDEVKKSLGCLQLLTLSGYIVPSLEKGVFEGLDSLNTLGLSCRSLRSIDLGAFNGLNNLKELHMSRTSLSSSLKPGLFAGLSNLIKLNLSHNKFTSLKPGLFEGLSSVIKLNLSDNQITEIEQGVFEGLSSVTKLNLSGCKLTSLEPGAFAGLSSVTDLDLSDNQITEIEKGVFEGLSSLKSLALYENQITEIKPGAFEELSSLTELNLSRNKINFSPLEALRERYQNIKIVS